MDITKYKAEQREIELLDPVDDSPTGMFFEMLPPSDPAVKQAEREYLDARLRKRKNQITAAALEAAQTKQIMAAVIGWRFEGDANLGGEKPEFSKQRLKQLITDHDWIRNFLSREFSDDSAFYNVSEND